MTFNFYDIIILMEPRKTLADPEEFAIVKNIYFPKDNFNTDDIDPFERLERQQSKQRNFNKRSQ